MTRFQRRAALLAAGWLCCSMAASAAEGFRIELPAVQPNGRLGQAQVFNGLGCKGGNSSPEIHWSGAPRGTLSFAVTLYDPDAPTGSGWWHWLGYDIPATLTGLPEHAGDADGRLLPAGVVQSRTDFGSAGYGGACPPAGDKPHRYIFTVYALKVAKLEVRPDSSAALVGFALHANELAKSTVTAFYGR